MNKSEVSVMFAAVVVSIVKDSATHPADFVREIGIAEKATADRGGKVSVNRGVSIAEIVKGRFAKGTHKSVIERQVAVWTALVELAHYRGMRLAVMLKEAGIQTGDADKPWLVEVKPEAVVSQ